jgi:hypothetical protein
MSGVALVRRAGPRVEAGALAARTGLHPDLVARFIRLGLVEEALPPSEAAARLARAVRMRRDLGVGYAGAVLACQLLARIEDLEGRLRRHGLPTT